MRVSYSDNGGYERLGQLLDGMKDDRRDIAEKNALIAAGMVVKQKAAALPSPRGKGGRVYKGHAKPGHIVENVQYTTPAIVGGAHEIMMGINLPGKKQRGFGYANPLTHGTSSMDAQPFVGPAFETSIPEQLDAIQSEFMRGMGLI